MKRVGLFRRKLRPIDPDPYPALPPDLANVWVSYRDGDDGERRRLVEQLTQFERSLPPAQQAYLRAEAVSTMLAAEGAKVGEAFEKRPGMTDGWSKGMTSMTLMYEAFAASEFKAPVRDLAGYWPVEAHYQAIVAMRDDLVEKAATLPVEDESTRPGE